MAIRSTSAGSTCQIICDRLGYRSIAGRLNSEEIESPRSGQWGAMHYTGHWSMTTAREILMNETYCGDTVWNRHTHGKFHRIVDGTSKPRPWREAGV